MATPPHAITRTAVIGSILFFTLHLFYSGLWQKENGNTSTNHLIENGAVQGLKSTEAASRVAQHGSTKSPDETAPGSDAPERILGAHPVTFGDRHGSPDWARCVRRSRCNRRSADLQRDSWLHSGRPGRCGACRTAILGVRTISARARTVRAQTLAFVTLVFGNQPVLYVVRAAPHVGTPARVCGFWHLYGNNRCMISSGTRHCICCSVPGPEPPIGWCSQLGVATSRLGVTTLQLGVTAFQCGATAFQLV